MGSVNWPYRPLVWRQHGRAKTENLSNKSECPEGTGQVTCHDRLAGAVGLALSPASRCAAAEPRARAIAPAALLRPSACARMLPSASCARTLPVGSVGSGSGRSGFGFSLSHTDTQTHTLSFSRSHGKQGLLTECGPVPAYGEKLKNLKACTDSMVEVCIQGVNRIQESSKRAGLTFGGCGLIPTVFSVHSGVGSWPRLAIPSPLGKCHLHHHQEPS